MYTQLDEYNIIEDNFDYISNYSIDDEDDELEYDMYGNSYYYEKQRKKIKTEKDNIEHNKFCAELNCNNIGYYCKKDTSVLYCREHKTEDMFNSKRTKCSEENCKKNAYYALDGEKAKYCKEHKKEKMYNVLTLKCSYTGCRKYPSYNYPGYKGHNDRCKTHKEIGMVDVRNPKCIVDGCDKFARFDRKTLCYTHKQK